MQLLSRPGVAFKMSTEDLVLTAAGCDYLDDSFEEYVYNISV